MRLFSLKTYNFRNLEEETVDLDSSCIVLVGENGQGKTNLLEALYYLGYGASFRSVHDSDVVRHGQDAMSVMGFLKDQHGNQVKIHVRYEKGQKEIKIDNDRINDRKSMLGHFPAIIFCHDDIFFINGEMEKKRRYLNQTISLVNPEYIEILRAYNKILKSRNQLLKQGNTDLLPVYNQQLAVYGHSIIRERQNVLALIEPELNRLVSKVASDEFSLQLEYAPSWISDRPEDTVDLLNKRTSREIAVGTTLSGPHRDKINLRWNGLDFTAVASTGQMRLASLLFRVVQASIRNQANEAKSVLLFDDVLLELDPQRRKAFVEAIPPAGQVFFTFLPDESTASLLKGDVLKYRVDAGRFAICG